MARESLFIIAALFSLTLGACDDKVSCHFDTAPIQAGVIEGEIVQIHLFCGDEEAFPGDISIVSSPPPVASVRQTADRVEDEHKGFYLLAHRPGTATLTASRSGDTVATVQVIVHGQ